MKSHIFKKLSKRELHKYTLNSCSYGLIHRVNLSDVKAQIIIKIKDIALHISQEELWLESFSIFINVILCEKKSFRKITYK